MISRERAGQIALNRFGGEIINVESEHENGRLVWEVEMRNTSRGRIEVNVDAQTGEVVGFELEDPDFGSGDE